MVQNIQSFSPPPFKAGGFNLPTGSQQIGAGNTTPVNNAFAAMGQVGGGFGLTTLLNNINSNPIDMYTKMNFDPQTALFLAAINGQIRLDPTQLNLKPQNITAGPGGFPVATGAGMSAMALNIALEAAITGLQKGDTKGFMSIMGNLVKDPNALQDPRFQKLVPAYQQLMGSVGAQSAAITTGANAAQAQQMAQIQQQLNQLAQSQQAIKAIITDTKGLEGLSAPQLAMKLALAMQSVPATTPAITTTASGTPALTTQQQTQALFKNQMKSATTT